MYVGVVSCGTGGLVFPHVGRHRRDNVPCLTIGNSEKREKKKLFVLKSQARELGRGAGKDVDEREVGQTRQREQGDVMRSTDHPDRNRTLLSSFSRASSWRLKRMLEAV
jgi:hypothetical protein